MSRFIYSRFGHLPLPHRDSPHGLVVRSMAWGRSLEDRILGRSLPWTPRMRYGVFVCIMLHPLLGLPWMNELVM
ncbi:hypothetical protein Cob_v011175 [Colletotrichum orbiculare MAFF 240422]|uniref:Uncharacterized protein n=1 Tax=Colletotrichum orbiculare (strain 104-T / ATCC 96160 / CBS 514.97 / LARS 414 / MAFF 240422) TaxID=1213857 RepID=A0A484FCU9_COLOR|nr:hypothetical protein Cob_v011175 [Colletotrichum orbiculare MAFF 240422]